MSQSKPRIEFVGEADFASEVLQSGRPVLAVFWAPWSRPCRILDPILEEVASSCGGRVKVVRVSLELSHGHHRYVFLVDGEPQLDPNATGIARDDRKNRVSLIAVS